MFNTKYFTKLNRKNSSISFNLPKMSLGNTDKLMKKINKDFRSHQKRVLTGTQIQERFNDKMLKETVPQRKFVICEYCKDTKMFNEYKTKNNLPICNDCLQKDTSKNMTQYHHVTDTLRGHFVKKEGLRPHRILQTGGPQQSELSDPDYVYVFKTKPHAKIFQQALQQNTRMPTEIITFDVPKKIENRMTKDESTGMLQMSAYKFKGKLPPHYIVEDENSQNMAISPGAVIDTSGGRGGFVPLQGSTISNPASSNAENNNINNNPKVKIIKQNFATTIVYPKLSNAVTPIKDYNTQMATKIGKIQEGKITEQHFISGVGTMAPLSMPLAGMYEPEKDKITVSPIMGPALTFQSLKNIKNHETGHMIDLSYQKLPNDKNFYAYPKEREEIRNNLNNSVTPFERLKQLGQYTKETAPIEAYANKFAQYANNPQQYKIKNPQQAQQFEKDIKHYEELNNI
jgi:hypothetical protein